ncbi:Crotonobetainyl-CoA:carnitine CoA-transferase CaiB [Seinonella peptonophila]|uniref:Crotonobetainyl-CoA:carnitine CoA-transferase CaiB n=1 Tax=Seinonella peptonophila TaxID=112248 RepID=A0A1M4T3M6_9BACL|nr:CaiB/BaiF CoA-transferase family protein [Seinonella peptonophila]SHE38928.1 Crotonobetainyl-CoA:carnitine CoA-transferase CaiB [Seinonella peptonophila]
MIKGPLDGIKILDFSLAMAGPFAAQKLGDMGADVIKIEPTGKGEWHRSAPAANAWVNRLNSSFISFNRNKQSLSIDLKSDKGQQIVHQLIKEADVVLQNFRPGVAKRLGIDYEQIKDINDRLIYCSISGYGETGPYVKRPGQDLVLQGYSGALWNTGKKGDPPHPIAMFVCDATAAHHAFEGILAALFYRERTGKGQKVEVNMLNAIMDMQVQELTVYLTAGIKPERTEEPLAHTLLTAPYGIYKTKDDYLTLAIGPIHVLGEALDNDRLRSFTEWNDGMVHRDEIYRIVASILPTKTTKEWIEILDQYNFWCGPVYDYEDLIHDPQVKHNEMIVEMDHTTEGKLKLLGIPILFSNSPGTIRLQPPLVGEHTVEILQSIGYSQDEIAQMKESGVVYDETENFPEKK